MAQAPLGGGGRTGWRVLVSLWVAILIVVGGGAGVLQVLGPPDQIPSPPPVHSAPVALAPIPAVRAVAANPVDGAARRPVSTPGRGLPGPVADPDPAMLEPFTSDDNQADDGAAEAGFALPRIAADGRTPMHEYAAGFDPSTRRPKVGILIAGIGMNTADSLAAIRLLPGSVTLAFSPYAAKPDRLLAAARIAEHEYLLSIPMEPQGFPLNDPDDRHALMSALPPADNLIRLRWVLSRLSGYAGVTTALGPMRGERLLGADDQAAPMLDDIAARGLLFIDARPGQAFAGPAWGRSVDLVLDDDPLDEATMMQRLDALTATARDKGSALGLVTLPRPLAVDRIAAYSNTLADKGLVLAPVSALVRPPAKPKDQVP